jgi:hypothetical protein
LDRFTGNPLASSPLRRLHSRLLWLWLCRAAHGDQRLIQVRPKFALPIDGRRVALLLR